MDPIPPPPPPCFDSNSELLNPPSRKYGPRENSPASSHAGILQLCVVSSSLEGKVFGDRYLFEISRSAKNELFIGVAIIIPERREER